MSRQKKTVTPAAHWLARLQSVIVEQAIPYGNGMDAILRATEIVRNAVKAECALVAAGENQPISHADYSEYLHATAVAFVTARGGKWDELTQDQQANRKRHLSRLDNTGWQLMRLSPSEKKIARCAAFDLKTKNGNSGKGKGKGRGKGKGKGAVTIAAIVVAAIKLALKRKVSNERIAAAIDALK